MFTIEAERPQHAADIICLLDQAFGPGRFAKTAYRLREGVAPIKALSFVAFKQDDQHKRMIASLRFTPILIGGMQALLLGPLAVDPAKRGKGCGIALMRRGLEEAERLGHRLVILVGDEPYYARVGFARVPPGRIKMPGPVDPTRLLYRELVEGALEEAQGPAVPDRG